MHTELPQHVIVKTKQRESNLIDAVPPHDDEAEAAALGSMLQSPEAAEKLVSYLSEKDFYNPIHREVFKAMVGVSNSLRQIDVVTVRSELIARNTFEEIGGKEMLIQLAESARTAAHAEYYAQLVREYAILRGLQSAGQEIIKIVYDNELDVNQKVEASEKKVFDVTEIKSGEEFKPLKELAGEFFSDVEEVLNSGEPIKGITTGYRVLDEVLGGLYPGNLVILAARPAVGKTSLALSIGMNVAKKTGKTVAVFSMEMSNAEIVRRIVCCEATVDSNVLKRPNLPSEDYNKLADACNRLYELPLYIDDTADIGPFEMRAKCRRLKANTKSLDLVIVDYLQLMRPPTRTDNKVQQITDIARALKTFAKDLKVPIIALSQLNREVEKRKERIPQLSDLRDSGSIEADADVVMLLSRQSDFDQTADDEGSHKVYDPKQVQLVDVIIAKNRNGPTKRVRMHFQPAYTRFTDPAKD